MGLRVQTARPSCKRLSRVSSRQVVRSETPPMICACTASPSVQWTAYTGGSSTEPAEEAQRTCLFASDDVLRVKLPEVERRPVVHLRGLPRRHLPAVERRAVRLQAAAAESARSGCAGSGSRLKNYPGTMATDRICTWTEATASHIYRTGRQLQCGMRPLTPVTHSAPVRLAACPLGHRWP